jgi:hypothetical protein
MVIHLKNSSKYLVILLTISIIAPLLLILVPSTYAQTVEITGKVTDESGTYIIDATIDLLASGTTTVVATTQVNSIGEYSVTVLGGSYDIQVRPSLGSGFGSVILLGEIISDNIVLDFVLVPDDFTTLSGQISYRGLALPNQIINLVDTVQGISDSSGHYSVASQPGDYPLIIMNGSHTFPENNFTIYKLISQSNLVLTQNTILDVSVPLYRVDVHVQDSNGNAIQNAYVATEISPRNGNLLLGNLPVEGHSNSQDVTNESGNAVLWLMLTEPGESYTLRVVPPGNSPFAPITVSGVSVTSDKTIIVALEFVHSPPVTSAFIEPLSNQQGTYRLPSHSPPLHSQDSALMRPTTR